MDWESSMSSGSSGNSLKNKFVEAAARKLAKEIDKEILQSLSEPDSIKRYIRRINFDY